MSGFIKGVLAAAGGKAEIRKDKGDFTFLFKPPGTRKA